MDGGLNRFAYAGGDPVNFVDPTGQFPLPAIAFAARVIAPFAVAAVGAAGFDTTLQLLDTGTVSGARVAEAAADGFLLGPFVASAARITPAAQVARTAATASTTAENASIVTRGARVANEGGVVRELVTETDQVFS